METVIDNEYGNVIVYPEKKIVHHQFKKFIFGEHLKSILTPASLAFTKHNCKKYLADDRNGGVIKPEDAEWGFNNWGKKLLSNGWKYWALVLPEKVVGQMSMKKVIEYFTSNGVTIKTFSDPQTAMTWLESQ